MWQAITAIVQLIYLILKNKMEQDDAKKKARDDLHGQAVEAFKNKDLSGVIAALDKSRSV